MAGLVVRDARRRRLRRLLGAIATIVAPVLIVVHAAELSDVGPVVADSAAPARVTVQPRLLTIPASDPATTAAPSDAAIHSAFATGHAAASADVSMHVQVLPGKAQWSADAASPASPRILSGRVLYAIGDNHAWQLVVHISGADGLIARPHCAAIDGSTPDVGLPIKIGEAPIVVCQGSPGHSGGIFSVAVDIDATLSGDVAITVELIA